MVNKVSVVLLLNIKFIIYLAIDKNFSGIVVMPWTVGMCCTLSTETDTSEHFVTLQI